MTPAESLCKCWCVFPHIYRCFKFGKFQVPPPGRYLLWKFWKRWVNVPFFFYQVLPLGFNLSWDCSALILMFQAGTDIIYLSDIGSMLPVHIPIQIPLNGANFPSQSLKFRQMEFIFVCSFLFLFSKKGPSLWMSVSWYPITVFWIVLKLKNIGLSLLLKQFTGILLTYRE